MLLLQLQARTDKMRLIYAEHNQQTNSIDVTTYSHHKVDSLWWLLFFYLLSLHIFFIKKLDIYNALRYTAYNEVRCIEA